MNIFGTKELSPDSLISKSVDEQYKILRKYILSKYGINYMNTYRLSDNGNYSLIDGNTNIETIVLKNVGANPMTRFNSSSTLSNASKDGIHARFTIPIAIDNVQYIIVLEAKGYKSIIEKEDNIYQDIITFKKIISKNPIV